MKGRHAGKRPGVVPRRNRAPLRSEEALPPAAFRKPSRESAARRAALSTGTGNGDEAGTTGERETTPGHCRTAPAITKSSDFRARTSGDGGRDSRDEPTPRRRTTSWNPVAAPVGPVSQSRADATNPNAKRAAGVEGQDSRDSPRRGSGGSGGREGGAFGDGAGWPGIGRGCARRAGVPAAAADGEKAAGLTIPGRAGNRSVVERRISSSERSRRATALGAAGDGGRDSRATLAAGAEEPGQRGRWGAAPSATEATRRNKTPSGFSVGESAGPQAAPARVRAAGRARPRGSRTRWRRPASRQRGGELPGGRGARPRAAAVGEVLCFSY